MRKSLVRVFESPSRSNVCCWSTRSSFTWLVGSRSPISSRKIVPLSAISKRPIRSATAPVKAPFTWPNISLSKSDREMPPRFTMTNGPDARRELRWMARATSSLPVPFSPRMSTGASDAATRAAVRSIESSAGSLPTMSTRLNPSVSGADVVVPASCNAVSTRLRNMRFCQGLVMKSNAPRRIPSTASGMLPQPVIRITGTSGRSTLRR